MLYSSNKNKSSVKKFNSNSFLSSLTSSFAISAFTVVVLFSASAMADNSTDVKKANTIQVSQQKNTKTHNFTIKKDKSHKVASEDGKVGAYSLSDGARRGAYGDGVYSNAD